MNPWYLLAPAFVCFVVGAFVSYSEKFKATNWFLPTYMVVGTLASLIWVYAVAKMNRQSVYLYSLVWDMVLMIAYYVIPMLFLVKMSEMKPGVLVGVGIMLTGLLVIKLSG